MSLYDTINNWIDSGVKTWSTLYDEAQKAIMPADPESKRQEIETFIQSMRETRRILNDWKKSGITADDAGAFNRLSARYQGLKDQWVRGGGKEQDVGFPVLLVLGVSVSAAAFMFGLSLYQYASALRDEAKTTYEEFQARKAGIKMAPSTLPTKPDVGIGINIPWGLIGGLVVGGGLLWALSRNSKD